MAIIDPLDSTFSICEYPINFKGIFYPAYSNMQALETANTKEDSEISYI